MEVSPVTMSHPSLRTAAPQPCLPLGIKDPLKEEEGLLLLALALGCGVFRFWLLAFAFAFGCGKHLEGKRIAGGELLKGNC
jgi:hypothetical protein